jgi:hypothetical protein
MFVSLKKTRRETKKKVPRTQMTRLASFGPDSSLLSPSLWSLSLSPSLSWKQGGGGCTVGTGLEISFKSVQSPNHHVTLLILF